jgi:stalled ribosome rescue protein Dom34
MKHCTGRDTPTMPQTTHSSCTIVWIDHRQADVFHLRGAAQRKIVVHSHRSVQRLHHQDIGEGEHVHPADTEFFSRIVSALEHPAAVLIAGPGQAKFALGRYLREKRPDFPAHVDHGEAAQCPAEAALLVLAAEHFPSTVSSDA